MVTRIIKDEIDVFDKDLYINHLEKTVENYRTEYDELSERLDFFERKCIDLTLVNMFLKERLEELE